MIKFGPAGVSPNMKNLGVKKSPDAPEILNKLGLNAFEYQCGNGVRITDAIASELKANCEKFGVFPSVHSPYFISLSSIEEEKRNKSVDYILQTAAAAKKMGAQRIVVHSGSCAKISREEALALAKDTIKKAVAALDSEGFSDIIICPETMGKINQLGTLSEVMELCLVDERLLPCIDFGHLNARTLGGIKTSEIEYTAGGEKRHLTFDDETFGPDFTPLAELLYKKELCPTIICESSDVMDRDALIMKKTYESFAEA